MTARQPALQGAKARRDFIKIGDFSTMRTRCQTDLDYRLMGGFFICADHRLTESIQALKFISGQICGCLQSHFKNNVAKIASRSPAHFSTGLFLLGRNRGESMNYVTFTIKETRSGEFVLYLHNHPRKLTTEQFRSEDLGKVVTKLKEKMKYRKHFMNALGNYSPVLGVIGKLKEKYADDAADEFPEGWTDPLELYGAYLQELSTPKFDRDKERDDLLAMLDDKSPEWIWENRLRLVAERIFVRDF